MERTRKKESALLKFRFSRSVEFFHLMAFLVISVSITPAIGILYFGWQAIASLTPWIKIFIFSLLLGPAYLTFGFSLIVISIIFRTVLFLSIRPGLYGYYDWEVIKWMGYNTFIVVVNKCFLDNFRLSPFQTFFYRIMGARIGHNVKINSHGFADLSLVEIGDRTMIGDGVVLICHAADRGFLRLAPVRLGKDVTIGLDVIIMPDVEIGDGAVIAPRSVVMTGTHVPPRGKWGGNPAKDLRQHQRFQKGQRRDARPQRHEEGRLEGRRDSHGRHRDRQRSRRPWRGPHRPQTSRPQTGREAVPQEPSPPPQTPPQVSETGTTGHQEERT